MNPCKHVSHVADRIVRVELNRSWVAIGTAFCERVDEAFDNRISSRVAILVERIPLTHVMKQLLNALTITCKQAFQFFNRCKLTCKG